MENEEPFNEIISNYNSEKSISVEVISANILSENYQLVTDLFTEDNEKNENEEINKTDQSYNHLEGGRINEQVGPTKSLTNSKRLIHRMQDFLIIKIF